MDFLRLLGDDVALDDASVFVGRRLRDDGRRLRHDDSWRVEQLNFAAW